MPRDRYGLTVSTGEEAATRYQEGIDRLLRLDAGAREEIAAAVELDGAFALGQATLALIDSEEGRSSDARLHLDAALRHIDGASPRERSAVHAVAAICDGSIDVARTALITHLQQHPVDALLMTVAFPTIAFSGVTETSAQMWSLVEGAEKAYGDDWWYLSLLSFVRQEQERYDESFDLAQRALATEPRSGHAVHAAAHVHYETGDYAGGLRWLDGWITSLSATTSPAFRSHASWHAALYELCLGDSAAVRQRWARELAPPESNGLRVLVDAGSMLHRCQLRGTWPEPPVSRVLEAATEQSLRHPVSAFAALHAGLAWATAGNSEELDLLAHDVRARMGATSAVVGTILDGLRAQVEGRHSDAVALLTAALPRLEQVGGSLAQRSVINETLLRSLIDSGQHEEARRWLAATMESGRLVHWIPAELADTEDTTPHPAPTA